MQTNRNSNEYWFPAHRPGIGWGLPRRWEGWVFLIVWLLVFFGGPVIAARNQQYVITFVFPIFWMIVLFSVFWWKGEKPFQWRER